MLGVDVSSWQHPNGQEIDWFALADAGYSFAMVKATQGTTWANQWLIRDLDDARAAGFLVGAYHFYEAGEEASLQGKWFVESLILQKLELGVWVDFDPGSLNEYTIGSELQGILTAVQEVRGACGVRCAEDVYATFQRLAIPISRWWCAAPSEGPPANCFVYGGAYFTVKGIPNVLTDTLNIFSTRGLNLATAPRPRPTAATTHPVALEPEPIEPEVMQTEDVPEPEPTSPGPDNGDAPGGGTPDTP